MPFALTFVGLILVVTGFQNTYKQFGKLVSGDFSGPGNFLYWMASMAVIGGIGYIKGLESFSRAFMLMVLITLVVAMYKKNPNFFSDIGASINSGSSTPVNPIGAPLAGGASAAGGGGGDSGGLPSLGNIGSTIGSVAEIASFL